MRLTVFAGIAVRTLVYLAQHPGRFVPLAEIATAGGMSRNHLMKVVQQLAATGIAETLRGPRGGVRLARRASDVRLGAVIRAVELLPSQGGGTGWDVAVAEATEAFIASLDRHSVADLAVVASSDAAGDRSVDRA